MKKSILRPCLLVLFLLTVFGFVFYPALSYPAWIDPAFKFSTIETEHFVIHFHQGLDEMADKAASMSEGMHGKLSDMFRWSPAEKTQIVLLDNTDFANGAATVLPYNAIYVFVVPPLHDTTLGEYDDWLELVLLHEYTHILTMDIASGYSSRARKVFGKTLPGSDPLSALLFLLSAPPNVFMPNWWLEGVATWAETEFTSSGRGRSSYVDMIFRMAVLEGNLPRIDQLNGDVPYWPGGAMPYIYGMLIEKHIAVTNGKETPGQLNISHSGRLPFFITAPAKRLTGFNYTELYRNMISRLEDEQLKNIRRLNTQPVTEYNKVPVKGEKLTNPVISPDGRYLALNRQDPHFHEEIVIVDAETFEEVSSVRRMPSDHHISWSPDSEQLYFTQAELSNGYNVYQDIYSYNLNDESLSRITKDIRAKDVDVSPDGKQLVFVRVETGRQNIALLSIKRGIIEDITDMSGPALSSPRWSTDGSHVLFSKHNDSGKTSIEILNVDTGKIETLTADDSYNIHPAWSPDGKFIIFSSDRTGVYNLFAISLVDKKIYQITHVRGGAFQPDMTREKGKIFFSGYSSKGFHIAEIPYGPSEWSLTLSPEIGPSWKPKDVQQAKEYVREETLSKEIQEKKKYCPLKTVLPKFWLPTLTFDHDGAVFGAFTAGQDVLGYHSYIIEGRYGGSDRGYYNLNYVYDRWRPAFFLSGYSLPVVYSGFFRDDDNYYERRTGVSAGLKFPLFTSIESRLSLMTGYNYAKASHLTDTYGRTVDGLEVYEGRRDNVFIGLGYAGALKYPYSISREEGRNISLTYRRYDKGFGSGLDQNEYALDYEEFKGLKKHHVIYLNLKGAVSDGDLIAQQAFQVGGFPSAQNEYSIRGFPPGFQTGRYVVKSTLEYRFPIKYFFRGWNTKPFFWDRLHVAAFADAGNVWGFNRRFDLDDFAAGIGAEARIDMVLGYKMKVTPAFGVAQGITDDGETQVYITIYTGL